MTEHLMSFVSDIGAAAKRDARPLAAIGRRMIRRRKGPALPWSQTMRRLVRTLGLLVPVVLVAGALAGCVTLSGWFGAPPRSAPSRGPDRTRPDDNNAPVARRAGRSSQTTSWEATTPNWVAT
jgi:hypothetical protein